MKKLLALVLLCLMMIFVVTGCGTAEGMKEDMSTMMTDASEMLDGNAENGKVTDDDGVIEDNKNDDNSNDENANFNDGVGDPIVNNTDATNSTKNSNSRNKNYNGNNSTSNSTSATSFPDSIV